MTKGYHLQQSIKIVWLNFGLKIESKIAYKNPTITGFRVQSRSNVKAKQ